MTKALRMTEEQLAQYESGRKMAQEGAKRSKYGNQPTMVDGIKFDSKKEATRYGELKLMEKAGQISDLRVHTRWELFVNEQLICNYESDFDYLSAVFGYRKVEDTKGVRTAVFKLKKKLMMAIYGIEVIEL